MISAIPGLTCVKPRAALYCFPRLDVKRFGITNDERLVLDFLREQKVLLVHGTGFNWPQPDHVRIVFLPATDVLRDSLQRFRKFLSGYRQRA